ncbi:MAG TPA: ATP-binding protein, partial [Croceibacterium sp.]|nr:ATP-binding protein [Croceibacterium sp.]
LEFCGNVALHAWQDRELVSAERTRRAAEQLASAMTIAGEAARGDRAQLMRSLDFDGVSFNWVPRTVITDFSGEPGRLAEMRERLTEYAPGLSGHEMRLNVLASEGGRDRDLVGTLRLADGSFISFRIDRYLGAPPGLLSIVLLHIILLAAVCVIAMLMVRTLIGPLRDLAVAADETGRNRDARIVPAGPHEVRRVATAFAAMQARLMRIMEDNTQALIAVSHDLRTPIQRLRLRAGLLDDVDAREAIGGDLAEMERFIDSTLAYVRSGLDEDPKLIDVATLVSTAVDDAADMGAAVTFDGPGALLLSVRPTALRRMLDNLLDNGRKYATRIEVSLRGEDHTSVEIEVRDDGPGIAEADRSRALQPFQRLEQPGGVQVRGAGLGLAFVQRTVEAQGGTMTLGKAARGGLSVRIALPDARVTGGG